MSIMLNPQRSVLPVDEAGRELLEYPQPAFPCFMEAADLFQYPDVPWHWHEVVELCLVRDGAIDFHVANHTHRLRTGEGGFTNRSIMHAVQTTRDAPALTAAVQFAPELLSGGAESALYQQLILPVLVHPGLDFLHLRPEIAWQREILEQIRAVLAAGQSGGRGKELLIVSHLARIWHLLLNHALQELPVSEADVQSEQRVKTMLQFIHSHYAEPLTLEQIAAAASISPRECSRCFLRVIGDSPVSYLIKYRISMAAALLENSGGTITQISLQTGFNNSSYFTRAFTRQMGLTPRAFRAARRSESADPGGETAKRR